MKESEQILFTDFISSIKKHFIESGWITVSENCIHSALVSNEKLHSALEHYDWDLRRGDNGVYEIWENCNWKFVHEGVGELEPFVLYRSANYDIPNYVELSQEFRVLLNMHEKCTSPTSKYYVIDDENGGWEKVAEINGLTIRIKLNVLRHYLALRKMHLLLFFDEMRYSQKTFMELGIVPVNNQIEKADDFIYNYTSLVDVHFDGNQSGGWIMGKCVLRYREKDYKDKFFDNSAKQYVEFVYGYNDDGDFLAHSCDKNSLSNYFVKNGDNPMEMTPVFFKKEVLDKYYSNPNKYTISDGSLGCEGAWSMYLDNDHRNYVVVPLVYLGYLDYTEQLYWKGYNIAPEHEMGLSRTAYTRWIEGNICEASYPDLNFKHTFNRFNKKWKEHFGWNLFLPLIAQDEHCYKSLHCLTVENNSSDFDEQILSLTKLIVDSLNQKCLVANTDDSVDEVKSYLQKKKITSLSELKVGIDKLEAFLFSEGLDCPDMIEFLRKVQSLRSNSVAHRKSDTRKELRKLYEYFCLDSKTEQEALEGIFINMIRTLNTLTTYFQL